MANKVQPLSPKLVRIAAHEAEIAERGEKRRKRINKKGED